MCAILGVRSAACGASSGGAQRARPRCAWGRKKRERRKGRRTQRAAPSDLLHHTPSPAAGLGSLKASHETRIKSTHAHQPQPKPKMNGSARRECDEGEAPPPPFPAPSRVSSTRQHRRARACVCVCFVCVGVSSPVGRPGEEKRKRRRAPRDHTASSCPFRLLCAQLSS